MRAYLSPALLVFSVAAASSLHAAPPEGAKAFLERHCTDCHSELTAEAGLDVTALSDHLDDEAVFDDWVHLFDRVAAGEMPPPDASTVEAEERESFVAEAGAWLNEHAEKRTALEGRVPARRLTAIQLERSLHDVLGIDVPLARLMPEPPRNGGFDTLARDQSFSHYDLENHLVVVDAALEEAFRRATTRPDEWSRELTALELCRDNPKVRCRDPEYHEGMAVIWSAGLTFYGRVSETTAKEPGWYRLTFQVSSLKADEGAWCTVRTGYCKSSAPLMTEIATFLATDQPKTVTVEAWLEPGQMFEIRPYDARLKKGSTPGGQVGAGEMQPQDVPGMGLHSATLARIHRGPDNESVRDLLVGDLELQIEEVKKRTTKATLLSDDPRGDLARLMQRFATRAFRRPVAPEEIQTYVHLAQSQLDEGDPESLLTTLREGYRSLLCSPRFVYLQEDAGELDDHALATRLSYFLWNGPPDAALRELAEAGELRTSDVLRAQIERMLGEPRGERFVADFARQWLDLSQIDFTQPDRKLVPNFDLIVQQSMVAETHVYLQAMLDEDLSVSHVIDSDFCFLNERLADYYGIDGVEGDALQRVPLAADSPRGGLLTQGAILKVTANGTTTSPILRGVWVSERLLGVHVPPPPQNVPAVEPDVRGATTIREQLELHKSDANCASCHMKVDPPGFALENFDPGGRWRDRYPKNGNREKGLPIDASAQTPEGEDFETIAGFQAIASARKDALARNLASHLIAYGTGAPVGFADRDELDRIVENAAASDYGFRTLLHEVVQSPIFRRK